MNAYELAKYIEDDIQIQEGIADMLRQQADRIAELEKQNKPIGVYDGKRVYITTPQTKPLSDEEIDSLFIVTGKQIGRASCRERVCLYV